jgi:hypothetical protein
MSTKRATSKPATGCTLIGTVCSASPSASYSTTIAWVEAATNTVSRAVIPGVVLAMLAQQ